MAAFGVISVAGQEVAECQVVVLNCAASHEANEIVPDAAELSGLLQELSLFDRLPAQMPVGYHERHVVQPQRSATTARTLGVKITQDRRKTPRPFSASDAQSFASRHLFLADQLAAGQRFCTNRL